MRHIEHIARQMTSTEREVLQAGLARYADDWRLVIADRTHQYRLRHEEEPNAIMVPGSFYLVAAGSAIGGLRVITPAYPSDFEKTLPYVCWVAFPPTEAPATQRTYGNTRPDA